MARSMPRFRNRLGPVSTGSSRCSSGSPDAGRTDTLGPATS